MKQTTVLRKNIDRKLLKRNQEFKETLDLILQLTAKIKHESLQQVVFEIKDRVETPFTFVIVGEVKAGKSSFVNALLDSGKEVCKVAPSPMTDTIQQILYDENEHTDVVNPYLKKIYLDIDILKEISIVDTPGTNTIVDHHQEITERFIPFSDLIVFVFEAKNPYRQSAWEFFNFINDEWKRKVIFVLQQKDLMKPDDLKVNIEGVHSYAKERGITDPKVFAVSALQEIEGHKDISGFEGLRKYLEGNITGGKAPVLKLENNIETARNINSKISESIDLRQKQYDADLNFRNEIKAELDDQSERSSKQAGNLVENLSAAYQRITHEKIEELEQGLSFGNVIKRSFRSIVSKEISLKEWLGKEAKDLEYKLNLELKDKLNTGIVDVAEQIQNMIRMIDVKLKTSKTILKNNDEIFSDIAEQRTSILKDLQASFKDFVQKSENFYDEQSQENSSTLAPNLAAGGGLAVVGVIITALTQGAVFDITGGILTAIGVLFAGVSLGWQRNKLLRTFKKEIKKGQKQLETEVQNTLDTYIANIRSKMDTIFADLDKYLQKENTEIQELKSLSNKIEKRL